MPNDPTSRDTTLRPRVMDDGGRFAFAAPPVPDTAEPPSPRPAGAVDEPVPRPSAAPRGAEMPAPTRAEVRVLVFDNGFGRGWLMVAGAASGPSVPLAAGSDPEAIGRAVTLWAARQMEGG